MTSIADYEQFLPRFDVFDPEHSHQKWDVLAYARANCPVPHTNADGGYHLVTRYEDVRQVLENPNLFSSSIPSVKPSPVRLPPLDADAPLHSEFRRILNPFLSRSYVLQYEQDMRSIAMKAIDSWIDDGQCEFVNGFAVPFSSEVLARVVFDETDPTRIAEGVAIINRIAHDQSPEAVFDMAMLCAGYLEQRESSGDQRKDLLGALLTSTIDGRPLTDEERLGVVIVLFFGGLDTTRAAIANIMANLVADPSIEARLRSPSWIRQDMDEFLRYESPVTFMARVVTRDTILGGVSLTAGDRVLVHFASANRDSAKFEDPDHLRFGLYRGGHAGFGLGIHRCVGSHLARVQLELAWDELLKRLTNFRLAPGAEIEYATGQVHGPEKLPITFERLTQP